MLSSLTSNHETPTFPTDIEGFGYRFDENGELRHIKTNERFEFEVTPGNQYYNQCHYEALGEIIGEYIEEELVKKYQFKKQIIPIEAIEDETIPKNRIYLSENVADCQILLFLIQGGGVVRSGQWSRKVIINDSLQLGSMFPYIERAKELNWGIIIFNPNEHFGSYKDGDERKFGKIPGSESHQSHCIYVWENIVRNMTAKHILIVGHSYGGISVNAMLDDCKDFKSRVLAIALTDSVHSYGMIPSSSKKWFKNHTINWIKSSLPTNDPVNNNANQIFGCECRSAGHRKHEYTSGTAIEPIFEYLKDSLHKQKLHQEAKAENKGDEEEKEEDKENQEQKNNLIDDNKMEVEGENDGNKEKGEKKEKKVTIKLENNEMEIDGKDTDNSIDNNIDNNGTNDNNNNNNTNHNDNNSNDNDNNNNNTNDSNTNDNNDNNNNNSNNTDEKDTNDIVEKDEKGNIVDNQVIIKTTKVVDNGDVTANGDIDNNVNDNINDIVDNNSNVDADITNDNNNRGNDDFNNKSNNNNKDDMEIEVVKVSIDDDNNKVDYNKIEHTNIEDGDIDDVNNNVNVENDKKIDVDKNVIVENSKNIDDVDKDVVAEKIEDDDFRKIKFQN